MSRQFRFVVSGRVQGVGFRAWTQYEAARLGLAGWVANLADGRVEVVVGGPAAAIDALRARLHEGSPAARVVAVEGAPVEPEVESPPMNPARFEIR